MTESAGDVRERLDAIIRGRVQGVGYRYFVLREAGRLGLDGWVANRPDGGVECRAEGLRSDLELFLAALREGPPGAYVDRVDTAWSTVTSGATGFAVRSFGHGGD